MPVEQWLYLGGALLAYAAMSFTLYHLLVKALQERCVVLDSQCKTLEAQCRLLEAQIPRGADLAGMLTVIERSYDMQVEQLREEVQSSQERADQDRAKLEAALKEKEDLLQQTRALRTKVDADRASSSPAHMFPAEVMAIALQAKPEWRTQAGELASMLAATLHAHRHFAWGEDTLPVVVLCEECRQPMAMWGQCDDATNRHRMCLNARCENAGVDMRQRPDSSLTIPYSEDE